METLKYFSFIYQYHMRLTYCQGVSSFITARKRSLRRLCFYTCLSVLLFTVGGVPGQAPPWAGTPPKQVHLPWAGTPRWAGSPPGRYTPLPCWEIRATNGRYAFYWNALLFTSSATLVFTNKF